MERHDAGENTGVQLLSHAGKIEVYIALAWRGTRVIAIFDMRVIATVKHILILYILLNFSLSTFDF
jgi:hypothetical protein